MSVSATFTNLVQTLRVATSFQAKRNALLNLVDDAILNITAGQLRSSGLIPILFDIANPMTDTPDVSIASCAFGELS